MEEEEEEAEVEVKQVNGGHSNDDEETEGQGLSGCEEQLVGLVACWLPIVRKRDSTQDGRTVQAVVQLAA